MLSILQAVTGGQSIASAQRYLAMSGKESHVPRWLDLSRKMLRLYRATDDGTRIPRIRTCDGLLQNSYRLVWLSHSTLRAGNSSFDSRGIV